MAEFCLDCCNRLNERTLTEKDVIRSDDLDLCEGCGKHVRVIVKFRRRFSWRRWLRRLFRLHRKG